MGPPEWFKCKSLLNGVVFQVDSLIKVNLILTLWFVSSSWKEQTIKKFVLTYNNFRVSLCCPNPTALKVWTETKGIDWIARSSGSWSYRKLSKPNSLSHLGLITSYLVSVNENWTLWELLADKALVLPRNHSFRMVSLLTIHQSKGFPCCGIEDDYTVIFCWRETCIMVDLQSLNVHRQSYSKG